MPKVNKTSNYDDEGNYYPLYNEIYNFIGESKKEA